MSRNIVILTLVLCAAIAGLVAFSKLRPHPEANPPTAQHNDAPPPVAPLAPPPAISPVGQVPSAPQAVISAPVGAAANAKTGAMAGATNMVLKIPSPDVDEPDVEVKPLPVLERNYLTTTNHDDRLDAMMDIADQSSAEAVRTLTRLFEAETDPDLKVDLIDSLLGIDGFKEEKLMMLTLASRQSLPNEVRQSAIDGLIDLDDPRTIPILNGLLNDPNEEIREAAQDALEMISSEPVRLK